MSQQRQLTWVGAWTLRGLIVFIGVFVVMLGADLLGLNDAENPMTSWGGFVQLMAFTFGITALLGIEVIVEHFGWQLTAPIRIEVVDTDENPPADPPGQEGAGNG